MGPKQRAAIETTNQACLDRHAQRKCFTSWSIHFIEGGARSAPRAFLAGLVLQPDRTVSATIARPSDTRRRRELL